MSEVPLYLGGGPARGEPGGLVFKAHRLLYHSTLGLRVIKKREKIWDSDLGGGPAVPALSCRMGEPGGEVLCP